MPTVPPGVVRKAVNEAVTVAPVVPEAAVVEVDEVDARSVEEVDAAGAAVDEDAGWEVEGLAVPLVVADEAAVVDDVAIRSAIS